MLYRVALTYALTGILFPAFLQPQAEKTFGARKAYAVKIVRTRITQSSFFNVRAAWTALLSELEAAAGDLERPILCSVSVGKEPNVDTAGIMFLGVQSTATIDAFVVEVVDGKARRIEVPQDVAATWAENALHTIAFSYSTRIELSDFTDEPGSPDLLIRVRAVDDDTSWSSPWVYAFGPWKREAPED